MQELTPDEVRYLRELPLAMVIPHHDVLLVHAGVPPDFDVGDLSAPKPIAPEDHVLLTKLRLYVMKEGVWAPFESNWKVSITLTLTQPCIKLGSTNPP